MGIERRRASDQIFEDLRRRILSGDWADGEQLPTERELAAEFDVSPNTVREGIRALGAIGLVEVRQGSGAFVRLAPEAMVSSSLGTVMRLETVALMDVLDLSRHLHTRIAELAVERAGDADFAALDAALDAEPVTDPAGNADRAAAFLRALADAAHEPLLAAITWTLDRVIVDSVAKAYEGEVSDLLPALRSIRADWAQIVAALRGRDRAAALAAVSGYFDACATIIRSRQRLSGAHVADRLWKRLLEDLSVGARDAL